jgi:hypothetical protein
MENRDTPVVRSLPSDVAALVRAEIEVLGFASAGVFVFRHCVALWRRERRHHALQNHNTPFPKPKKHN